jgi:hypothetical protein
MRQLRTLLTLTGLALSLQAADLNEHFQGTWKMDIAKSTFAPGMGGVKSMTITFKGDQVIIKGETDRGEPMNSSFHAPADGKLYASPGQPYDHVSAKQLDPDHQLVTFMKDGHVLSTSHVEIKGNTMTTDDTGTGPDGKSFKAHTVAMRH